MKTIAWLGFIGGTIAAVAVAAGCSSDDASKSTPLTESGQGESCARTSDCQSGLLCLENVCTKSASIGKADGGTMSSGTGGSSGGVPTAALGDVGESCTRRADCKDGLACVRQTCVSGPSAISAVDGGAGASAPVGVRGESCQNDADCGTGLTCVPRPGQSGGICDLANYGLKPTGKSCGGQCAAAADCCQLPPSGVEIGAGTAYSCSDLVDAIGGAPAAACPTADGLAQTACFYYQTYCSCGASTWSCTANTCVYGSSCTTDATDVLGGCPSRTRTGEATANQTCDLDANKCAGAAVTGCTKDTDCDSGLAVAQTEDTCTKGECACLASQCYRKCSKDVDCPSLYTCDSKTSVCVSVGDCVTDTECANRSGDSREQCRTGKCVTPCGSDQDCSPSGLPGLGSREFYQLCGPDKTCVDLGCSSDAECSDEDNSGHSYRTFCVAPAAAAGPVYHSALPTGGFVF